MAALALTCGDPAGVGPELAIAAFAARHDAGLPPFYVLADPELMRQRAARMGRPVPLETAAPETARSVFDRALPVVPLEARHADRPGQPDAANAAGIIEAIDRAVTDTMAGRARAVVTAPIAKKVLYTAGFKHPGHTEYLAHLAERITGRAVVPVMMLAGPSLRVVPVTIHIPLSKVARELNAEVIERTARVTASELRRRFAIAAPRLAVSGLNPHAGEGGTMGMEEITLIGPAIERLRAEGIDAVGPLPADTMFHARARAAYDAALCMYHDQALIAAKAIAFDETVNVTLGLPFVRTSPDHGTAFDIAGQGQARPDSLIAALKLAERLADGQDT